MEAVMGINFKQQLVHDVFEKVGKFLKKNTNQCMAETSHLPKVSYISIIYLMDPASSLQLCVIGCLALFFNLEDYRCAYLHELKHFWGLQD